MSVVCVNKNFVHHAGREFHISSYILVALGKGAWLIRK